MNMELARNQPCGCICCICEDDDRCYGCGANKCQSGDDCVFVTGKYEYKSLPQPGDHINGQKVLAVVEGHMENAKRISCFHPSSSYSNSYPVTAIIVERQEKKELVIDGRTEPPTVTEYGKEES